MKIEYVPQRSDKTIDYNIEGEVITASLYKLIRITAGGDIVKEDEQVDTFDLSGLGDGNMVEIETTLAMTPIIHAERVDGELFVKLRKLVKPIG